MKYRLSRAVLGFLEGTGLFQGQVWSSVADEEAAAQRFRTKVNTAETRKDGARLVDLTVEESYVLRSYVESMVSAAGDSASFEDLDALAELNSGNALLRKLPTDPRVRELDAEFRRRLG